MYVLALFQAEVPEKDCLNILYARSRNFLDRVVTVKEKNEIEKKSKKMFSNKNVTINEIPI